MKKIIAFIFIFILTNYFMYGNFIFNPFFNYKCYTISNSYINKYGVLSESGKRIQENLIKEIEYNLEFNKFNNSILTISFNYISNKLNYYNRDIYLYYNDGSFKKYNNIIDSSSNRDIFYVNSHKKISKIKVSIKGYYFGNEDSLFELKDISINCNNNILYEKLLFSFMISLLIFILIFKLRNISYRKCLVLVSFLGIIFSILMPLYQVPDEEVHMDLIYDEFGFNLKSNEVISNFNSVNRLQRNSHEKVLAAEYFNFNDHLYLSNWRRMPNYNFIRHFPQGLVFIIVSYIRMPVILGVSLVEISAWLFYIFVCYNAVKIMPIKKELFIFVMLLPICIQQSSSFSYDVLLFSCSFWYIAYFFYLKYCVDDIGIFNIIKLLFVLFIIGIIKIPYMLLGLLIFNLPFGKIKVKNINFSKYKYILIFMMIILFLGIVFLVEDVVIIKILRASIIYFPNFLKIFSKTMFFNFSMYMKELVSYLGYFDCIINSRFLFIFIICGFIFVNRSDYDDYEICFKDKVLYFILTFLFMYVIVLSMFSYTLECNNIDVSLLSVKDIGDYFLKFNIIDGVQGRYFVPFIIFPILLFENYLIKIFLRKLDIKKYMYVYYILLFIYLIFILVNRYFMF